ncbi:hypothetical protein AU255_09835 [Methyloprofundus sedimenti]|uniref:Uncharacterized protein n=1 Tax=Methyloprofundus sedimenti TaxID=1420851 RepID=A0A1V8M9B6_9GAMM|nr:hypothetical protein [Methyloprofundus sedimenti]OQK18118.1 hypothetical protein AU255_09835 [Methyloprofundus sedimenti]
MDILPISISRLSRLLIRLDQRQCEALWAQEPFSIDSKYEYLVLGVLKEQPGDTELQKEGDVIKLSQSQVSTILSFAVNYLNLLEVIFASWKYYTADRNMIEAEFYSNISPKRDFFPLNNFRIATGIYPSIAEFTLHMKNKYNKADLKNKIA